MAGSPRDVRFVLADAQGNWVDTLFNKEPLAAEIQRRKHVVVATTYDRIIHQRHLREDVVDCVLSAARFDPLRLALDQRSPTIEEEAVISDGVRRDQIKLTVRIPFAGEDVLLTLRPEGNRPAKASAAVSDRRLVLTRWIVRGDADSAIADIEASIAAIQQCIELQRVQLDAYHAELPDWVAVYDRQRRDIRAEVDEIRKRLAQPSPQARPRKPR